VNGIPPASGLLQAASRLFRGASALPRPEVVSYARRVHPFVSRAERSFRLWLVNGQDVGTTEDLANTASVQRWEYANWYDALSDVDVPAEALKLHDQLLAVLRECARAAQLLSVGYRSTTYATVCDGEYLLTRAHESVSLIARQLDLWLEHDQQRTTLPRVPSNLDRRARQAS
jgi:hypothetical protein